MSNHDEDGLSTFVGYQSAAIANQREPQTFEQMLTLGCMGLMGEAGEVSEMVKKHLFHDKPLPRQAMLIEMGDVLWYLMYLSHALDSSLEEVAFLNYQKLKRRYPDGFTKAAGREVHKEKQLAPSVLQSTGRIEDLLNQKLSAIRILIEGLQYHEHDGHDMPKRVARNALIALGIPEEQQP